MTQPLEIITLGGLTIQRNQVVVTGFVSRKVEALLVYLACEPREHPREFLASLLWDDVPQARAMANLRMALSSLQQQLEDYVVVTRQTIAINPYSPIKIDVRELTTTLDKAELTWARAGRLPRSLIHDLDEALSLYHGDFLAGFHLRDSRGFDDWRLLEQERLRANMIAILNRLAEQLLEQRTYAEGLDYASRLLQLDPLREETHRLMMQLQVGLGERSAAIAQYKTCERLLQQELGVEPSAETIHLYQQIVQGVVETVAPAQPPKHNLPFPSTPFIERPAEQMQIAERLDRTDCRLLSLVGPGGTGKTRLALHAALERVEDYHDGVYLVTFNPVDSPAYLLPPIAAALKLKTSDNPIEDLLNYLRDKRMLLILDNSEYVLEGASVLDEILNHTQWLKIIAISRERLQLQQEWVLPIGGLECPPAGPVTDPEQYGAVQLFAYSARRVQAHFSLDQDFEGVRRVCALVEGMPLGLELASAWTSVMSVAQIATQIEQSLGFLETALRNVPQRHRSIRALFEHSWTMLNEAERDTLTRLSVFQNKFDLQSAEAVAESTPAIMLSLVEKSLVRSSVKDSYDLHSFLRRYAGEKLQESGEASATFEKHARFFTQRVEADAAANQEERTIEYYEDARAALEWLASTRNTMLLRLSSAMDGFWQRSGYLGEGREWLDRAIELVDADTPAKLHAGALNVAGKLAWRQGDFEIAGKYLQQTAELARMIEDNTLLASALMYLGYLSLNIGDHEGARDFFAENLEIARILKNQNMIAKSLGNLGLLLQELTDYAASKRYLEESVALAEQMNEDELTLVMLSNLGVTELKLQNFELAEQHYQRALGLARKINSRINMAITLVNLGELKHFAGNLQEAVVAYTEGLERLREFGDKLSLLQTLEMIAFVLIDQGNFETAIQLYEAAAAERKILSTPVIPREHERHKLFLDRAREQFSQSAYAKAQAVGQTLSLDQAIDLALNDIQAS